MISASPSINQTAIQIRHVRYSLPLTPCNRCGQPVPRVWEVSRTAIDIDLDRPVLLLVTVSVHHCVCCANYLRAQPPFLRPDAVYTNRVVTKAVQSVYQDGMAATRVARRLARDFWVQPSATMIRQWCREYTEGLDFADDYLPWVVETFSGVLCIDEVYQDRLALLLTVDPAVPAGDQLVHGAVQQGDVEAFLKSLQQAGIAPQQVITDGSALYPGVVEQVWPMAVHQLCLFHETRRVTDAVAQVLKTVRASVPKPSARGKGGLKGRPPKHPSPERIGAFQTAIAEVHLLREQGYSIRAIARQTRHSRSSVRRWLRQQAPEGDLATGGDMGATVVAGQGVIAEPAPQQPPEPWESWEQVQEVIAALMKSRWSLLRRPEHLEAAQQAQLDVLFASPIGEPLQIARSFLEEWYALWTDEQGRRRSPQDARERYEQWHSNTLYAELEPLGEVQRRVNAARFESLSHFLEQSVWEATNNGAEREGRAFRQGQAPHYRLRTSESIEGAIKARACLRKEELLSAPLQVSRCARGRKPKQKVELQVAA